MIRIWTQYAKRIKRHYANEHSKEGNNEDSSCDVCYPPDISIADPTYLNFLNWFKSTYKIRYHTSRTITYYSDRKSTRLNSSHDQISYAVFCLKKKIRRIFT